MDDINRKIKEFRLKLGLTQVQFADKIGLSQPNLSALEAGKREVNLNILMRLKDEFYFDLNDFLYKEISDIDINPKEMPKEELDKIIESEARIRSGQYKDKQEEVKLGHRQITARFLRDNNLEDIDSDIFIFGLTAESCSFVRKYCLGEQTLESFSLYREGLITREMLLSKYKEVIEKEKQIYDVIKPYEKILEELSEKLDAIIYGDLKV